MKRLFLLFVSVLLISSSCNARDLYRWDKTSRSLCDQNGNEILGVSCSVADGMRSSYKIKRLQDDLYLVKWNFSADKDVADAHISVDVTAPSKSEWWLLPAVSYNGNNWGSGNEPKGASDDDRGWWVYSYRRSPIPGAIYSEDSNYAIATWCGVPGKAEEDFSYSIMPEDGKTTHRYIWPEEETPRAYFSRDAYSDGWRKSLRMAKGECLKVDMFICVNATEDSHRAVSHFMKSAWNIADKVKFAIPDDETLWNYGIRFAKESLWDPSENCIGFRTGILPDNGKDHETGADYGDSSPVVPGMERNWRKAQYEYQGGWCGRNLPLACAMLADYLKNADKESLEIGMSTLDHWAKEAPTASGLIRKGLPGGLVDACHLGTETLAFRDAYELASKCGYDRPEYLKIFFNACNAILSTQREDGCYPRSWTDDEEGRPTSFDGFTSTYLISPMLEAYNESGDKKYLDSAQKAFGYFIGEFNKFGFTTAGALDTHCIDKESSDPLIASAIQLYDITNDKKYLDDAVALGYYLSSWIWTYDGVYPSEDSFTKYGFHTFGGTSVSTQHQCLDNYGLHFVSYMKRLAELTGDKQWGEKADALHDFGCQLISDGHLEMNGRVRPFGGQNEAFFQAEWHIYNNKSRFDNWLVAWPTAFRLELQMK